MGWETTDKKTKNHGLSWMGLDKKFRQSFNMWPNLSIKPAFYYKIHLYNKTLTIGQYFYEREWKFDSYLLLLNLLMPRKWYM